MGWWDDRAYRLQQSVRSAERDSAHINRYDAHTVKTAIVHARQDLAAVYSQISSLNAQVRMIKWLLGLIAALLVISMVL